nr:hypothetical protein [Tanacetum cinerariifolium]
MKGNPKFNFLVFGGDFGSKRGGKKNTKQGDHVAGKKNNTNGSTRYVLDTGFPPLADVSNPSSYANKLSPTSMTKANLRKLDANVTNDADYDIWLPLASVHKDGLSLIASKIGSTMLLDSYLNSMCLESWGKRSYARILIKIDAYNDFLDNIVMFVRKVEGLGYTKETIPIEYEWKPPHCGTCLIFGHLIDDCPKGLKRVVNMVEKGKSGSSKADDVDFTVVKQKKSSELVSKAPTSGMHVEGQSPTPIVNKINRIEKIFNGGEMCARG